MVCKDVLQNTIQLTNTGLLTLIRNKNKTWHVKALPRDRL